MKKYDPSFKIFVINPGSTSTKVAVYDGSLCIFEKVIRHDPDELKGFSTTISQLDFRLKAIRDIAEEFGDMSSIDAFAGRGGILRPLRSGTYIVGKAMLEDLTGARFGEHASNLGAVIANGLAAEYGKSAYIVDPVVVDELMEEARVTGLPGIRRKSIFHALNQKAAAKRAAAEEDLNYEKCSFIVAHLGGGISVGAHYNGRVIEVNNAIEEGPFSPERAGSLPSKQLVDMCFSGLYKKDEIIKLLSGRGGLMALTGSSDCRKLEAAAENDIEAKKILNAMIYKVSREICANAAALSGRIDRIIITGGLAYSKYIVDEIEKRVSFLGPVIVYPGEDEMAALSNGVLRVLEGQETALEYEEGWV